MKKICVLSSGGDAPGMNACIEAIFLKGNATGYEVYAAIGGLEGLIDNNLVKVAMQNGTNISGKCGSIFKCSRSPRFLKPDGFAAAVATIKKYGFDAVIVIGGNGSMIAAAKLMSVGVPVVFVPATIDNDVFYTKHNLGFSSACESAVTMVDMLKGTMETNNRDHIVQLMGRHCGELAHTVGLATFADIIDMEGNRHTPAQTAKLFAQSRKNGKTSNFMIMQEKKCTDVLAESIQSTQFLKEIWEITGDKNIRMNTLGHLQRGAPPTCRDRYLGVVYGQAAIDCVINKRFGVGTGLTDGEVFYHKIEPVPAP